MTRDGDRRAGPTRRHARRRRTPSSRSGESDRRRASQAETLLGINAFAASGGAGASGLAAATLAFGDAVRADPGTDDAKFDLELLLRLAVPHGKRAGHGQGGRSTGSHRGAGGGTVGRGY